MKVILLLALSVCAHAQFFGGNAAKIRGKNVKGSLSCADGDAITWITANNQFECAAPGAVGSSVGVKKAGTLIGTRAAINLIEGSNVTLTVTDDAGNNEVDVTVAASGAGSGVAVENNGSAVATEATINFVPGTYTTVSATDAGSKVNVTFDVDTGTVLTKATSQAGGHLYCASTASGAASTCSVSPTLTAYTTGQPILWVPDANITAAHTLNIDSQGAVSIKMNDGSDPTTGSITSGRPYWLIKRASSWTVVGVVDTSTTPTVSLPLLIGVCTPGGGNMGLGWTYSGTNAASTSCQSAWSGSGASDRLTLLYNTANMVSYAHFGVPTGITGGSLTLKFHIQSGATVTPTFEAAVGCYAVNADTSSNISFGTPVTVTWAQSWGTANRMNRGSVTISSASIVAGNYCMVLLRRTDANGSNFFVNTTWLEF